MRLVDWNIQWGRGVDGRVVLARIVREAKALCDFDILCPQELTRGFHEGPAAGGLAGGLSADQFAELAALLPHAKVIEDHRRERHQAAMPSQRGYVMWHTDGAR